MAEAEAVAEAPVAEEGEKKGGKLWLWIAVAAVVLLGGGGAGYWYFFMQAGPEAADAKAKAEKAPLAPPLYAALDPPFVVNFETEQLVRFLQVTVQLMSRDPATIDLLKANDPVIRNDLLLLFGNQKYDALATRQGKEKLRADALVTVRRSLASAGGDPKLLEAVYFTSFVMQ
jgi:flagellar FliL protein